MRVAQAGPVWGHTRAWPLSPATDQVLGGVLTWIPPAMMTILGALVVLRYYLNYEQRGD